MTACPRPLPGSSCRHVRRQGVSGHPQYGYSLYTFSVTEWEGGADLARGRAATASSAATGYGAERVLDGDAGTRGAVAVGERTRQHNWLSVDLGSITEFDRLTLAWESAAATAYRVQGSTTGRPGRTLPGSPKPTTRAAVAGPGSEHRDRVQ
ncbi:discoidin domain-containing protein [Streptomyces sp. NPDC057428]|uniref:discoidin domain-containing protein n=1 Tax=Streptomyces sp. NPDC057428 TaxID=3346129 RepID=UPI0036C924B6